MNEVESNLEGLHYLIQMAKKKELWERQSWDTQASFSRFHKYYLSQASPRSLNKAYRRYRTDTGQKQDRKKEASAAWRNWFRGKNYRGKGITGAIGWAKRATAFDDYCAQHDVDKWIERREKVRHEDWLLGEDLRELATSILEEGPSFLIQRTKFRKGKDGDPDKVIITLALDINAAVKAGGLASKLQRLAAGMETENLAGEFDILQQVKVILPDNLRGDRGVEDE